MEAYPPEYVVHNLPLIVLSGLVNPQEHGGRDELRDIFGTAAVVNSDSPLAATELGQQLLQEFMSADGSGQAWSAEAGRGKANLMGFKFKVVGRVSRPLFL
jgi:trafficking protein particle complex subunit 11